MSTGNITVFIISEKKVSERIIVSAFFGAVVENLVAVIEEMTFESFTLFELSTKLWGDIENPITHDAISLFIIMFIISHLLEKMSTAFLKLSVRSLKDFHRQIFHDSF
jgi:hypothetical protein